MTATIIYAAAWVVPVCSAPIENGAVAVRGPDIIACGERSTLLNTYPSIAFREFGNSAILPGLVNCHSHLELTAMRGFLEPQEGDFLEWLKKLTVARLDRMTPDDLRVSAALGAVEAARAGVTCLGDASDNGSIVMDALREVGLRATVYQESFGPDPSLAQENLEKLRGKVSELQEREDPLLRPGVSPHAPYTVSAAQLEMISEYAVSEKLPLMIHAAESVDESIFLQKGTGVFAEDRARRNIPWIAPELSPIRYLERCGILRAMPLLAHCIHVDDDDIDAIKAAGASVAHCPKSNAKLGHGRAPLAAFLKKRVPVGLGSDSVASNYNCDILEEARFATLISRAAGESVNGKMISGTSALYAATLGGAQALGQGDQIGAIAEGRKADLTIISLSGSHQLPIHDPVSALIFSSSGRDVICTIVGGREIYAAGRVLTVDEERLAARMDEIRVKLLTSS